MAESTPLTFTEMASELPISIITSASRDGLNAITSMCDWSAIATELGYSTAKSAHDQWHKLKAKKLKSSTDSTATPKSTSTSTKRKKIGEDGEGDVKSPSTAKKARKEKQDKRRRLQLRSRRRTSRLGRKIKLCKEAGPVPMTEDPEKASA